MDAEAKRTGRPRTWVAYAAARAWIVGRSRRSGTTRRTAGTRTARDAAPIPTQRASRFTARPRRGLRGLDGRELPGVVADGAHERPELLHVLGGGLRPLDESARRIIHRVIQQRGRDERGDEIASALLPGLGDLSAVDADLLHVVGLPRRAQPVALRLQRRVELGSHAVSEPAHIALGHGLLDLEEGVAGHRGEHLRIEAGIHLPDVAQTPLEVRGRSGRVDGGRAAAQPLAVAAERP